MQLFDVYPLNDITITRAAGSRVYDEKGQEYDGNIDVQSISDFNATNPHPLKGDNKNRQKHNIEHR